MFDPCDQSPLKLCPPPKKNVFLHVNKCFLHLSSNFQVRQGLKTYSNWPTYPQLYVKGELIGGLDIVKVRSDFCFTPQTIIALITST